MRSYKATSVQPCYLQQLESVTFRRRLSVNCESQMSHSSHTPSLAFQHHSTLEEGCRRPIEVLFCFLLPGFWSLRRLSGAQFDKTPQKVKVTSCQVKDVLMASTTVPNFRCLQWSAALAALAAAVDTCVSCKESNDCADSVAVYRRHHREYVIAQFQQANDSYPQVWKKKSKQRKQTRVLTAVLTWGRFRVS